MLLHSSREQFQVSIVGILLNKWIYFNFQVILESLRMANIISFTFREAVVDVEYKGKD